MHLRGEKVHFLIRKPHFLDRKMHFLNKNNMSICVINPPVHKKMYRISKACRFFPVGRRCFHSLYYYYYYCTKLSTDQIRSDQIRSDHKKRTGGGGHGTAYLQES